MFAGVLGRLVTRYCAGRGLYSGDVVLVMMIAPM